MKRILLHSAFIFCVGSQLFAQSPVLNEGNLPALGYKAQHWVADEREVEAGPAGQNVRWDFTDLTEKWVAPFSTEYIDPASTMVNSGFPDATLAVKTNTGTGFFSGTQVSFYSTRNGRFELLGQCWPHPLGTETLKRVYETPATLLATPLQYGDTVRGTTHAVYQASGVWVHNGTYTIAADAYGTVDFIDTSFTNVLRLHTQIEEKDTSGYYYYLSRKNIYTWLVPGRIDPILTVTYTYRESEHFQGRDSVTLKEVTFNPSAAATVSSVDNEFSERDLVISRSGRMMQILLSDELAGLVKELRLLDALGREHMRLGTQPAMTFDVAQLPPGVYFVQLGGPAKGFVRKILLD